MKKKRVRIHITLIKVWKSGGWIAEPGTLVGTPQEEGDRDVTPSRYRGLGEIIDFTTANGGLWWLFSMTFSMEEWLSNYSWVSWQSRENRERPIFSQTIGRTHAQIGKLVTTALVFFISSIYLTENVHVLAGVTCFSRLASLWQYPKAHETLIWCWLNVWKKNYTNLSFSKKH